MAKIRSHYITRQNYYRTNGHHCKYDLWNFNAKVAFRKKQTRSSEEGHSTVLNKTPSINLVQVSPMPRKNMS